MQATAINDAGQVVGTSFATGDGFITGPNGVGMKDLGALSPAAVNNAGQVAGDYEHTPERNRRSFITGPNGVGMKDLGMLPGGELSSVIGINNVGQVVGNVCCFVGGSHAFITGPNGGNMTYVPDRAYGWRLSDAFGINDAGQVVGYVQTDEVGFSGFITGPNGVGTTLFDMRPETFRGINNAGQVVGSLYTGGTFITGPNGVGVTDLGALHNASDINDAGQMAGNSGGHVVITGPNGVGMTDLDSLVQLPGGFVMDKAIAINNVGQVLVSAFDPAVIIPTIPEPESYALMLAGLVLTGVMVRRKQKADAGEEAVSL